MPPGAYWELTSLNWIVLKEFETVINPNSDYRKMFDMWTYQQGQDLDKMFNIRNTDSCEYLHARNSVFCGANLAENFLLSLKIFWPRFCFW